ncbi:PH domain-containing protein [Zalerion maritima]|uniref:PH domain-containing protein n=1 Tax=Zalerion maritima TaxID=339359 RepID=A0AAD5RJK9_9PEZI|nr:PH domain-containing protein [Zalerion maritima]
MADDYDPHNTSEISDQHDVPQEKEDAETAATRKELKHTAISEQPVQDLAERDDSSSNNDKTPPRSKNPDDAQNDFLREQVGSPKKKRAHDEVEVDPKDDVADISLDAAASPPPGSRTARSEPEKKRPRDEGSISVPAEGNKKNDTEKSEPKDANKPISTEPLAPPKNSETTSGSDGKAVASEDAFKKSGFSALSAAPSPFVVPGSKVSVFSGNASSVSPFGAPACGKSVFGSGAPLANPAFSAASAVPTLPTLGNSSTQTPFGLPANGSTGSSFGSSSGFSRFGPGGAKLVSFATPGQSSLNQETKPSRNFGAPESEDDDGPDDESSDKEDEKDDATSNKEKEGSQPPADDKKKPKLQKVQVDDGEAGEATLLSVRAKIYALDKSANVWKERGTGYLKINAPEACVETDDRGTPIPGSFDASSLDGDDAEDTLGVMGPRLIMRQDHTHRVILNAAVVPALKFTQTDSLKAAKLMFQAFEDNGMKTLSLKMSNANAKEFLKEYDSVIRELTA